MICQETITLRTKGRGTFEFSAEVERIISNSGIKKGLCNVFIQHTSASLILCENADPAVRKDLEAFMSHMVPDGDPLFRHTTEGPDDMPAHVRSVLTGSSLLVPVSNCCCALGTWQGIYLWEHRHAPHERHIVVTIYGD
ncbi:MAG: secondary thiamine-phosphate synthase [Gammaproteobacteria bacterium]|nr:secondary thiamine-phosphate synthase [Gammaproteobacteria bacterium]